MRIWKRLKCLFGVEKTSRFLRASEVTRRLNRKYPQSEEWAYDSCTGQWYAGIGGGRTVVRRRGKYGFESRLLGQDIWQEIKL